MHRGRFLKDFASVSFSKRGATANTRRSPLQNAKRRIGGRPAR